MDEKTRWFDLQLFGDGGQGDDGGTAGDGTGGDGTDGDTGTAGTGGGTAGTGGANPRTFTQEEVQAAIRGRLAEEQKKYQNYDTYKGLVERISTLTGQTPEAIAVQLEQIETQRRIQQQQQQGISPEIARQLESTQRESQQTREQLLETQYNLEEERLVRDALYAPLKEEEIKKSVREFAKKNNMTLEQAFWATQGPTRAKQMQTEIEQRVSTSLREKMARGGVLTDDADDGGAGSLTPEQRAAARLMGLSEEEYKASLDSPDLESYRKARKAKK